MVTTTTNCVEYLLELEGKLEFIWDIFSGLSLHHYNYDIINMNARSFTWKTSIWLRYTETVLIKNTFIVGKVISQIKTSILFFLETCCTTLILKKGNYHSNITRQNSNFSKIFTSKVFEVSNTPTKNLNWLKHLKNLQVKNTYENFFLGKLLLGACNFTKTELRHRYFARTSLWILTGHF